MTMRKWFVLAVSLLFAGSATAQQTITRETFEADSVSDIVALCSAPADDGEGLVALGFCFGWLAGVDEFYKALLADERFNVKPVACPDRKLTRDEIRVQFVEWAKKNPDAMDMPALAGIIRAARETYPCAS